MSIFPLVRPLPFACSRVPSLRLLHLCPCNAGCQASVLSMRRLLLFSFYYIKFAPHHTSRTSSFTATVGICICTVGPGPSAAQPNQHKTQAQQSSGAVHSSRGQLQRTTPQPKQQFLRNVTMTRYTHTRMHTRTRQTPHTRQTKHMRQLTHIYACMHTAHMLHVVQTI